MADEILGSSELSELFAAPNCTNGIEWIMNWFGECVVTPVNLLAFVLGFVSLLLWLIPMIPQVLYSSFFILS